MHDHMQIVLLWQLKLQKVKFNDILVSNRVTGSKDSGSSSSGRH